MPAAVTDKFKYLARKWVGQIGAGGVSDDTVQTIPLSSTSNLPTATGITVVIDRVDANGVLTPSLEETVIGVVSGSNLVSCTRGVEGTAQAHSAGAVVEVVLTASDWQSVMDGILVNHGQDGLHSATDFNGTKVTIDADADTSMTADTDDQIDWELGGSDRFRMKTSDFDIVTATGNITVAAADPWRTIDLPAASWAPTTTAGCAAVTTVEAGTNDIDYKVLDFDKATDENAFINFQMPASWDAGVIQFRYVWTSAGGSAAETVVMELSGRSYADDDAIDQAVGTAVERSDALIATGDIHISAWSGDVTLTGATAGEWIHLELMRDISEDNLDSDARLIGVQLRYKQAQYSD